MVPSEVLTVNSAQSVTGLFVRSFTLLDNHLLNYKVSIAFLQNVLDMAHL